MFLEQAAQRWWTLVIRGILAIAFGVAAIMVPQAAVTAIVIVFAVYSIVEGVAELSMFLSPRVEGTWLLGLSGVVSIAAGILALVWPGITAIALFLLVAWWAIALGVIELIAAIRYSHELENEWAFVLSGLLFIGFGVIVIGWPGLGVVAVLSLIATAAILRGIMLIVVGARLRSAYVALGHGSKPALRS